MKEKWEIKKLGEVCTYFNDGNWIESKDQSEEGIRLVQTGNVGNGVFKDKEERARFISEETFKKLNCTEVLPNDVLISRLPEPIGRACIVPDIGIKMITAVDCTIARFNDNTLNSFYIYYSQSKEYAKRINVFSTGTTRKRISRANLFKIPIPIPPLSVQQSIVTELDTLHRLKELQEQQLTEFDNLAQSTFYSLFGDPIDNEKGWDVKRLGEVCENLFAGGDVPKNNMSIEKTTKFHIPIYTNGIKDDGLYGYTDYARVNKRSLTISSRGTIGYIVLRNEPFFPAIRLIVVTPKHFMNCNFVMKALQNMDIKSSGTSIPQLTVPDLKNKIIILPPLSLQTHFSERIEKIEAQKELIKQSIGETQLLIDYTMDKYFG